MKHIFLMAVASLVLVWLVPHAVAMVPGPTEEDDVPPPPESEPIFSPSVEAPTPKAPTLTHFALYPPDAYQRCLSIGLPNHGALQGGVLFPRDNPFFTANRAQRQWGTPETVDTLLYAAAEVHRRFGPSHKLALGDISRREGGKLNHHASHQAGRDVDVGFYFRQDPPGTFKEGTAANLDVPRTWAFVTAIIDRHAAQYIFLDYSIQAVLYDYAKNVQHLSDEYLARAIQYPRGRNGRDGIIQHAGGHRNHLHVRFVSPIAVANAHQFKFQNTELAKLQDLMTGRAAAGRTLVYRDVSAQPDNAYQGTQGRRVVYIVRTGDTLWSIARRHGATVSQIRAWNRMSADARPHVGQRLTIFVGNDVQPDAEESI